MTNNNRKPIPAIVEKFTQQTEKKEERAYNQLDFRTQRAIHDEVNLQVMGYEQSQTYGEWTKEDKNARLLVQALREDYAQDPKKICEVLARNNRDVQLFELKRDRDYDHQRRARAIAARIDRNYQASNQLSPAVINIFKNAKINS